MDLPRPNLFGAKRIATGLLILMAALAGACVVWERKYPDLAVLRAFAEAATVGACADWFAVTALFRRPLGLPIPHTALLLRNKGRIAQGIGGFFERNFLSQEAVDQKLSGIALIHPIARWLADPLHARDIARRLSVVLPAFAALARTEQFQGLLGRTAEAELSAIPAAPTLGRLLGVLIERGHHETALNWIIEVLTGLLEANQDPLRAAVSNHTSRWIPKFIDDRLFESVLAALRTMLDQLFEPDHPWRLRAIDEIETLQRRLLDDPTLFDRLERIKGELLADDRVRAYIARLWSVLIDRLNLALAERGEPMWLADGLAALGAFIGSDPELEHRLDTYLVEMLRQHILPHRTELTEFITDIVERWDARTFVAKIESAIGPDLQFIRINGTVVGGLVGLSIHLAERAAGLIAH